MAKKKKTRSAPPTATKPRRELQTLTITALAAAIGVDHAQLLRESARRGFPVAVDKGRKVYEAAKVIAWREKNIRMRKPHIEKGTEAPRQSGTEGRKESPEGGAAGTPDGGAMVRADPEGKALFEVLSSADSSALEISRAAMRFAARRVAAAGQGDALGFNDLDDLKKALGELRQAEADYIELSKLKRELMLREEVRAIVGACAARLVACLGVLENAIATEFATWLADPAMRDLPADDRARKIREFVAKTCDEVRRQEAEGVDKLIDKQLEEE